MKQNSHNIEHGKPYKHYILYHARNKMQSQKSFLLIHLSETFVGEANY